MPASPGHRPPAALLVGTSPERRRIALAAAGGVLLTLRTSLHEQLNGRLVLGWLLTLAGLAVVLVALRPRLRIPDRLATPLGAVVLALGASGAAIAVDQTVQLLTGGSSHLACRDDVALATFTGGTILQDGGRPYTTYDAVEAARGCPGTVGVTVLRQGTFAGRDVMPTEAEIQTALAHAQRDPAAEEIERRLAYPGGSVIAGLGGGTGFVILEIVAVAAGMAVALSRTRPELRVVTGLAMVGQLALWTVVADGHTDAIAAGLLAGAWAAPASPLGGLFLGLACGTKQTAWFLAPALVATAWSRGGRAAAVRVTLAATAGFLALNAWFIGTEPSAWLTGILSPARDGLFPLGAGAVGLVTSGVLPAATLPLFSALLYGTVAAAAWLAWRYDSRLPGIGAMVALMALWLGPRSLLEYMAPAGLLAVVVVATGIRAAPAGRTGVRRSAAPTAEQESDAGATVAAQAFRARLDTCR